MPSKERGVFLPKAGPENDALGEQFMRSPEDFAMAHGLDPSALSCPQSVHDAFQRGETLAAELQKSGLTPDSSSIGPLRALVSKHLGDDFEVALIPFGLKFRERMDPTTIDVTGTGSGTVTWLDTDADVDG